MKPLFIIGYMACGKTTFGTALSKATGLQFIDLDRYIEKRHNATIRQLFSTYGEEGFRKIERDSLIETCTLKDTIIACGGGTPCFFDNMEIMNAHGTTLWLQASHECLCNRLTILRHTRPLLAEKSEGEINSIIRNQLKSRTPFYSKANQIWDGEMLEDDDQIAVNISSFLSSHPEFNR